MARIRTIKPEFFTSADVMRLTPLARLLYIGLWCEADREGRLPWRPASFRVRYLPADDCAIDDVCRELIEAHLVVLYGDDLAHIPSFTRHQAINARESPSMFPAPPEPDRARVAATESRVSDASVTRERADGDENGARVHARVSDASLTRHVGREGRKEGKGREHASDDASPPDHPTHPIRTSSVRLPRDAYLGLIEAWNVEARRVASWVEVDPLRLGPPAISRAERALQTLPDLDAWEARFARAAQSSHLTGRNGKGFVADFWWLLERTAELDAGRFDERGHGESRRPELVDISARIAAEAEERRLAAEERAARQARKAGLA